MNKGKKQSPDKILEQKIDKMKREREWIQFCVETVVLLTVVYVVFHYIIGIAFVSGHSMEPTLKDGELLIFYRLDDTYGRDDLVLVHREGNVEYIKRIVTVAGDTLEIDEEGKLWINGEQEQRSYIFSETWATSAQVTFPYEVPEGCYFVLGDNRSNSEDSRVFGAVNSEEITGRACLHLGRVH